MTRNKSITIGILICWFLPVCVFSQQTRDSVRIIKEILAIGKRTDDGIISYQKLSGAQLENINSVSVAEALRYFSGVQLKDYGGIGGMKTVNIRGMGSEHVGVFYDGIQLGNAQNGIVDLGKFSLDNIEAISLYNGQKSQIFQPAKDFSSAGSIYLVTRKPNFTGNKKTNLNINYRSGSFSVVNPSVLWEQKLSEKVSSSVNLEYLNADGKYKFRQKKGNWDTVAVRQNGNINAFRAESGLFGKFKNGKWTLKEYYYDSHREIPGAVITNSYARYRHEQQWDRNFFLQGSIEKQFTSKYKLLVNAKFASDYMRYYNLDTISKYINNIYKQKEFYVSTAQEYSLTKNWNVALSIDYQLNKLDANLPLFAQPVRNTELAALASSLNFNRLKLQASFLGTFVQENIKNKTWASQAGDKQKFTPAFFFSYQPFAGEKILSPLQIHGFYKQIFRMPTFNDLYYTSIGNSHLQPEYTTQYDIGLDYLKNFDSGKLKNLTIAIDGYYNKVTNKIIAFPKSPAQWAMINFGKVRILGIDVTAGTSWLINSDLLFHSQLTYTYENTVNLTSGLHYKNQIPYMPQHSGTFLLGVMYKNWNWNYNFIYAGERYKTAENSHSERILAWDMHDFSLNREFQVTKIKFKLGMEINNLFDKQYDIIDRYPMPGRNYRITLKINL
ncbi:MAG: TonB-dependent receptor [Flavobacteriaceae bacterium]|nr:TonB-dependent receptor [Flavobacteriaceae bacterium]